MHVLEVLEDENGMCYLQFPDDLLEYLNWLEGDVLDCKIKEGGFYITKVNDPCGYEVIDE
jgi:hypothetical protein